MAIDTVEKLIAINEYLPEKLVKYSMLFVMRHNITPLWEDPLNCNGGCFSYKVINKFVEQVWKQILYRLCGESLAIDSKYSEHINGVTISPKKNFCIIKIWLKSKQYQDPQIIDNIENLTKNGVMFKNHNE